MKKRILFINSNPVEVQIFQRLLADQHDAWEVSFLPSGHEALALLAREPIEVVFADLSPTDMTGLELLGEIAKRHPRTVRFLLANEANNELIMECVWNMHQYLSKETSAGALVTAVNRSLTADSWLANEKLKALVARMRTLPTMPSLYFEVMRELNSSHASAETVGEIIGKDLAMTAKMVQMVNSAYFGLPRTITTPGEAVLILGLETVKSLVLSIHAFAQFDKVKPLYFTADKVWRHCLRVGALAKRVSEIEVADQKMADEALTAGLFHDLGKLLMATNLPDEYNGAQALAQKQGIPLWEVEKEIFGATHGETGAYLLGLWGLSVPIVEAVALHDTPSRTDAKGFAPLTAVHVANALDYQNNPEKENLVVPSIDLAYLADIGMEGRLADWQESMAEPTQRKRTVSPTRLIQQSPPAATPQRSEAGTGLNPWWIWGAAAGSVALLLAFLVLNRKSSPHSELALANQTEKNDEPKHKQTAAPLATDERNSVAKTSSETSPAVEDLQTTPIVEAKSNPNTVPKTSAAANLNNYRLQGIFYRQAKSSALINGQTVFVGDTVDGGRITSIDHQSTTLEVSGQKHVIKLR